jgi:hypothetical protein
MKPSHEDSPKGVIDEDQGLDVSSFMFPRRRGVPPREAVTLLDVKSTARSISDTQSHLSRLRVRFRRSLGDLPDNNQEEFFALAFKAIDQALAEARDRLVANDLEECRQYVSTSNAMLIRIEDKLDRLLRHNTERQEA